MTSAKEECLENMHHISAQFLIWHYWMAKGSLWACEFPVSWVFIHWHSVKKLFWHFWLAMSMSYNGKPVSVQTENHPCWTDRRCAEEKQNWSSKWFALNYIPGSTFPLFWREFQWKCPVASFTAQWWQQQWALQALMLVEVEVCVHTLHGLDCALFLWSHNMTESPEWFDNQSPDCIWGERTLLWHSFPEKKIVTISPTDITGKGPL